MMKFIGPREDLTKILNNLGYEVTSSDVLKEDPRDMVIHIEDLVVNLFRTNTVNVQGKPEEEKIKLEETLKNELKKYTPQNKTRFFMQKMVMLFKIQNGSYGLMIIFHRFMLPIVRKKSFKLIANIFATFIYLQSNFILKFLDR